MANAERSVLSVQATIALISNNRIVYELISFNAELVNIFTHYELSRYDTVVAPTFN
jgi:hypothetical protein